MRQINIAGRLINDNSECFVVAEIGHNHQGSVKICMELFKEAARCGADAVKLQKRNNKELFTESEYTKPYDNPNSYGATYGEHREFLEFNKEQYLEVKNYAESLGLIFFSTAFDFSSVDFLEDIDVPCYKVASGDLRSLPLLEKIAKTGKPIIISTGASFLEEVRVAYETILKYNDNVAILQCTAGYPINANEAHLNVIETYRREFPNCVIGYSGHDNGILLPVIAWMKGARIIEKHFTLNRANKGTDHRFSLTPSGLRKTVRDLRRARQCLGNHEKICLDIETPGRIKMAKSIVAMHDLPKGTVINKAHLSIKSPGGGMSPDHLDSIHGRELRCNLKKDTPILAEHFKT